MYVCTYGSTSRVSMGSMYVHTLTSPGTVHTYHYKGPLIARNVAFVLGIGARKFTPSDSRLAVHFLT